MESSKTSLPGRTLGPRARVIAYLLWTGVAVYFVGLAVSSPLGSRWLDFPVYWEAGQKALHGATVYDVGGHFQYKYSPLIALLVGKLFQALHFESASWIFQKTMLLLWARIVWQVSSGRIEIIAFFLLFFGNALRLDLALGQMNALVLYLLLLMFALLEKERSRVRDLGFGLLFSFAVQLKLFSLVIIPVLLFRREWRKFALGVLMLPILSLGGVALAHGPQFALSENREWLRSLATSTDELVISAQNAGLLGTLARAFPWGELVVAKALWIAMGTAFLVFLWRNRIRGVGWFRNQLLLVIAVFNPLVWSYWILFSFPLAVRASELFPRTWHGSGSAGRTALAVGAGIVFFAFNGQHANWAWNGGILFGLIFVWFLARDERKQ